MSLQRLLLSVAWKLFPYANAQIKTANSLMNDPAQHPYIEDINNWGKTEYWATAFQFLRKSGDCEDFSIAKYMLLKAAGMPVDDMRVVAVRIRSLGGIGHAILVVYQGSKAWVLDNRTNLTWQRAPVSGMTCIRPIAPFGETAFVL